MSLRTSCAACGHTELITFLDLGKTPLANKFPTWDETNNETFYPLQLGRCASCSLVQMMEIIADEEIYGADYGFYSGGSQAQRDYHKHGAELLGARFLHDNVPFEPRHLDPFVVEIACNDGSLLKYFTQWGYRSLGIDPAAPAQMAIDEGLPVLKAAFTHALAQEIRAEHGAADLVIAYNSMAHVGDLADVLSGVRTLLAPSGVAVVEVQYLPDLLAGGMYDQVYHEHRYYYSLSSFMRATAIHGLRVVNAELIELQGGGIRFTLAHAESHRDPSVNVSWILQREAWVADGAFESLQGRVDRFCDHMLSLLRSERDAGHSVAGYAAAAKATTILNYAGLGPAEIPFVIDTTPYKQGRYVPGTKIPIVAEGTADVLLLNAPNYLAHVLRAFPGQRWLLPIPPVLI